MPVVPTLISCENGTKSVVCMVAVEGVYRKNTRVTAKPLSNNRQKPRNRSNEESYDITPFCPLGLGGFSGKKRSISTIAPIVYYSTW